MPKLNEQAIRLWIDALRHGGYEQGFFKLKLIAMNGEPRYCAWGVLCDLFDANAWRMAKSGKWWFIVNDDTASGAYPPPEVREWVGFSSNDAIKIAKMSDQGSFDKVADYLEGLLEEAEGEHRVDTAVREGCRSI